MAHSLDLDAYFARIGYDGAPRVDERTLWEIHAAHLAAIPYENLDIQLGQQKILDEAAMFEKIVGRRRGGWCYEMNGLLSAVLRQIGFEVDRVGGAVARHLLGDDTIGNHMVLIVKLAGREIVADAGLGDGPLLPFPIEERQWDEDGFVYRLERADGSWWRLTNHEHGLAPAFDFTTEARDLEWYRPQSTKLQKDPTSIFAQLAMTFRRDRGRIRGLRDLTAIEVVGSMKTERRIRDFADYARTLDALVDFDLGEDMQRLFTRVSTRVAEREAEQARLAEAAERR